MEMNTADDRSLLTALEQMAPHDHLALIYEGAADHFGVAIPFIQIGLDRGEKCIYIADDGKDAAVRDARQARGIHVEEPISTNTPVLETQDAPYLHHRSLHHAA